VAEGITHGLAQLLAPSRLPVAVLKPPLPGVSTSSKLGGGNALHFYTRVAVYIRGTYYVPVGKAGSPIHLVAVEEGGRPYAQPTSP